MNTKRMLRGLLIFLAVLCASSNVLAAGHSRARSHGFVRFGVVAAPAWGYYRPSPYYYPYYAPVVVAPEPLVYIEQNPPPVETPQPSPNSYWYYCVAAEAYYPYVKTCPAGWQKVLPQAADPE